MDPKIGIFIWVLIATIIFSVFLKLWAFDRIGSYSIDLVISALLYCFINIAIENDGREIWFWKSFINIFVLLILCAIHSRSLKDLNKKINQDFSSLKEHLLPENKEKLDALKEIVKLATEVAYTKLKPGKKDRRKEIRASIKALGFDPQNILDDKKDDTFMLSAKRYRWYLTSFIIFTTFSLVMTILPNSILSFLDLFPNF